LFTGESQLFTLTVSGGTLPYAYQWYLDGLSVPNATSGSWTFTPASTGAYTVYAEVTDAIGSVTTSKTATITVAEGFHDIAVTGVVPCKTVVCQGYSLEINVTVADLGTYAENLNVTAYANTTFITSQNVTLHYGTSTTLTLACTTTGYPYGNYTLSAYATPVPGETNTTNNNCTGGTVFVGLVGDITGPNGVPDGRVDMRDISYVAKRFLTTPSSPLWDPNADILNNGKVDKRDISIVAENFGKTATY